MHSFNFVTCYWKAWCHLKGHFDLKVCWKLEVIHSMWHFSYMDYTQSTNSGSNYLGFVIHKHLPFFTFISQTQLSFTLNSLVRNSTSLSTHFINHVLQLTYILIQVESKDILNKLVPNLWRLYFIVFSYDRQVRFILFVSFFSKLRIRGNLSETKNDFTVDR